MFPTRTQYSLAEICKALIQFGKTIDPADLFPTVVPEAARVVIGDPYAFSMATCLDRGMKADIIWTIPYDIKNHLGHLDPQRIYKMSLDKLAEMFARLPRRPRYVNAAPRTVWELTRIVVEECGGDASRIWKGKRALEVKRTFQSIYGVGEGIANMAVLLIEAAYPHTFDVIDRRYMDIKPDEHTQRVLYRLGASAAKTEQAALDAARRLSPDYPGEIDGALWIIGREYCHPTDPECRICPVTQVCVKKLD